MKLTLDWNCVIEVEQGQPQAAAVGKLIAAHRAGQIEVALLVASASENTRSKLFPGNAGLFTKRIVALGWQDLPLVPMPGIWGLSYWDFSYALSDGEAFETQMDRLWSIIAPETDSDPKTHLAAGQSFDDQAIQSEPLSRWRNAWCDIISAYSHIAAGRDVFVTNNTRDFQKNHAALASLGMASISTPAEAAELLTN